MPAHGAARQAARATAHCVAGYLRRDRSPLLVRVLSAFIVLCTLLVGPVASAATDRAVPPPIDPRLLIIGDSVILGAQGWIAGFLGPRGWRVNQTSRESMHTWEAPRIIDANRARGGIGDVVVLQLGTNDGISASELSSYMETTMQHLAEVDRVYWVNMRQFRSWVPAANAVIAAAAVKWPNLRIIDWDARATPDPSLVYADGYHLTGGGQLVMAELIATTLDEFVLETGGAPTTTTTLPTTSTSIETSSTEVSVPRKTSGVSLITVLAGLAGVLLIAGIGAMFAMRVRRKPDSSA